MSKRIGSIALLTALALSLFTACNTISPGSPATEPPGGFEDDAHPQDGISFDLETDGSAQLGSQSKHDAPGFFMELYFTKQDDGKRYAKARSLWFDDDTTLKGPVTLNVKRLNGEVIASKTGIVSSNVFSIFKPGFTDDRVWIKDIPTDQGPLCTEATWDLSTTPAKFSQKGSRRYCPAAPPEKADLKFIANPTVNAKQGETITVPIKLENAGPKVAKKAKVLISKPAGLEFVSVGNASRFSCQGAGTNHITCTLDELPVGAKQIDLSVRATGTGTQELAVSLSSDTPDPYLGNNQGKNKVNVTVVDQNAADLIAEQQAEIVTFVGDQNTTLGMVVANAGPKAASNAKTTVSLPDGIGSGGLGSGSGGVKSACSGNSTIICTTTSLPIGEFNLVSIALRPQKEGTFEVAVNVSSDTTDPNAGNNATTIKVIVKAAPQNAADLEVQPIREINVSLNTDFNLDFNLQNLGPDIAKNAKVTFTTPAGLTVKGIGAP